MFLKTLLGKNGPSPIPTGVRTAIQDKLKISADELSHLRSVDRDGHYAGRNVRFIRVFDPRVAGSAGPKVRFDELSKTPNAILFEGHIEKSGALVITERRATSVAPQGA